MALGNFAYSTIATAPSPATSGTSLVVASGGGATFPAVPFKATVWPAGDQPLSTNAEIVTVTAVSTDTLTITRAQEGTTARSIVSGDQIAATLTAANLPGTEIAPPDTITSSVTVTSTTEASGTTVISAAAHTFDGEPVIATFSAPFVQSASGAAIVICLFEGTTQICRFGAVGTGTTVSDVAFECSYRFSPSAGPHTFKVTAFMGATGSGQVRAGAGGTADYRPAFLRFTKV